MMMHEQSREIFIHIFQANMSILLVICKATS